MSGFPPAVEAALAGFSLPATLGFGIVPGPVMFNARYEDGSWSDGELLPYGEISILPTARSLQFAETIFEGTKAYLGDRDTPHLFRPDLNLVRFRASAQRIGMPPVPEALFMDGLKAVVSASADFIPRETGSSLYLRPFLFSTEPGFAPLNSSRFRFMITTSPSGPYTSGDMKVMIERRDVRAARHGIGYAKTGGNYAAAMRSTSLAVAEGYTVSLWLDPEERRFVEELSGMNLFAVVEGALVTPPLSDTILPGVTRRSILDLARMMGLTAREEPIAIDALVQAVKDGSCTELFACGTAAIIAPVVEIGESGGARLEIPERRIADALRADLLAIQERRAPDPFGWTVDVQRRDLSERSIRAS